MTIHAGDTVGQRLSASSRPGSVPTAAPSFRHEALLYEDFAMFFDATLAFIEDGLKEDAATLVAVSAAKIDALRTALGAGAGLRCLRRHGGDRGQSGPGHPGLERLRGGPLGVGSTAARDQRADLGGTDPGRAGGMPHTRVALEPGVRRGPVVLAAVSL